MTILSDFNPRSHKGSDRLRAFGWRWKQYFNPRSHKGSDGRAMPSIAPIKIFQSTLPQGERPSTFSDAPGNPEISIHAPTRGATETSRQSMTCQRFQSTLPQGERLKIALSTLGLSIFQSTLPQGERQQFYTKFHICFISFLPILSPYHISTHSPLPTFNHFLYIFSGANRPEISCLLPFRTKTIFGIL